MVINPPSEAEPRWRVISYNIPRIEATRVISYLVPNICPSAIEPHHLKTIVPQNTFQTDLLGARHIPRGQFFEGMHSYSYHVLYIYKKLVVRTSFYGDLGERDARTHTKPILRRI
jgi:hypothetical protein